MKIEIKIAKKIYFSQIIKLLQVISDFYPNKNTEEIIWESFINQKEVYGFIAIDSYAESFDKKFFVPDLAIVPRLSSSSFLLIPIPVSVMVRVGSSPSRNSKLIFGSNFIDL